MKCCREIRGTVNTVDVMRGSVSMQGTLNGSVASSITLGGTLNYNKGAMPPTYMGPYEVTPKAHSEQTLATKNKLMTDDVTVFKVPYYETSNVFDGLTVFIAEDSNG